MELLSGHAPLYHLLYTKDIPFSPEKGGVSCRSVLHHPTCCCFSSSRHPAFQAAFLSNAFLWFGEWLFHVCLALIMVRHLRFFLEPVPACVFALQTPVIIAGYLLPLSLIYIFIAKLVIEKRSYMSSSNFFLLALLLLSGISGLLMKLWFRPDLAGIKLFALGMVTFRPVGVPHSPFFVMHFVLFLIVFAYLPTHIAAAPIALLDARQREKAVRSLMHEE